MTPQVQSRVASNHVIRVPVITVVRYRAFDCLGKTSDYCHRREAQRPPSWRWLSHCTTELGNKGTATLRSRVSTGSSISAWWEQNPAESVADLAIRRPAPAISPSRIFLGGLAFWAPLFYCFLVFFKPWQMWPLLDLKSSWQSFETSKILNG